MAFSVISTGNPLTGTDGDDFLLGIPASTGTNANTIVAQSGNDLVLGDAGNTWVIGASVSNGTMASAVDLNAAAYWSTDENPLFGDASIPHTTAIVETTLGEFEYFKVNVAAGQTLTVDIDFGQNDDMYFVGDIDVGYLSGRPIGVPVDTALELRDAAGALITRNEGVASNVGGLGSMSYDDPYLSYTATSSGTVYIRVDQNYMAPFRANDSFLLNISVSGHATSPTSVAMGDDRINGGDDDDLLLGQGGDDLISGGSGSDLIDGGSGNDLLYGGTGNDSVRGGDGNDRLQGDRGWDRLDGGNGDDELLGGDGNDLMSGGAGNDRLDGGTGSDYLEGGSGADTLLGGDGDDWLEGGQGPDVFDGGTGADTLGYVGGDAVTVNLATHTGSGGDAEGDTFAGIENISGGAGNDTLTGDDGNNLINGNDGDDVVDGGGGNDELYGGLGADTLFGGDGDDTLIGEFDADRLVGGAGNDSLNGGLDADNLAGGVGNDSYTVDNAGDVVVERENEGTDIIYSSVSYTLPDHLENLAYTGWASDFTGIGNSLANVITGNNGNDTLEGGAGADTLIGRVGADRLSGGDGNDTLAGDDGADLLIGGRGHDRLDGGAANDSLFGGSGVDWLDGGQGDDRMVGGAGFDTFVVDSLADEVIEAVNAGTDTVLTSLAAYTLGENVENVTYTGADAFTGHGNALANVISSGDGNDTLAGGAGNDRLSAGRGHDRLDGGDGNDRLLGGSGVDVLAGGAGNDILEGGAGADVLSGDNGRDVFTYRALTDSSGSALDTIIDFSTSGRDRINVSPIDADSSTEANDRFNFIGSAAFSGTAGELRYADGLLQGDVNGDRLADLAIKVTNLLPNGADLIL